jgi:hypothetical protein
MFALQIVFLVLAGAMIFFWLAYALTGPRKIDQPGILQVLHYGPIVRTAALMLATAPPVLMACVVLLLPWRNAMMLTFAGVSFLTLSALGGLLLFEVEGVQIALTEGGLIRFPRWGNPVTVPWMDVEHVSYSRLNRWFVVHTVQGSVKVSRHLVGIAAFVAIARRKVGGERCAGAAAVMDAVLRS